MPRIFGLGVLVTGFFVDFVDEGCGVIGAFEDDPEVKIKCKKTYNVQDLTHQRIRGKFQVLETILIEKRFLNEMDASSNYEE